MPDQAVPPTRWTEAQTFVREFLALEPVRLSVLTPSKVPTEHGVYCIWSDDGLCLRAGMTAGAGGLRQRLYQNHLMGNQPGNLLAQLVADPGMPPGSIAEAKAWARAHGSARWEVINDAQKRTWGEHVLHAILRPRF